MEFKERKKKKWKEINKYLRKFMTLLIGNIFNNVYLHASRTLVGLDRWKFYHLILMEGLALNMGTNSEAMASVQLIVSYPIPNRIHDYLKIHFKFENNIDQLMALFSTTAWLCFAKPFDGFTSKHTLNNVKPINYFMIYFKTKVKYSSSLSLASEERNRDVEKEPPMVEHQTFNRSH